MWATRNMAREQDRQDPWAFNPEIAINLSSSHVDETQGTPSQGKPDMLCKQPDTM